MPAAVTALVIVFVVGSFGACGDDADRGAGDAEATASADTTAATDSAAPTDTTVPSDADATMSPDVADATALDATTPTDATTSTDATTPTDASGDTTTPSCLEAHQVGESYPKGDHCNLCECGADGIERCGKHSCKGIVGGCSYAGVDHAHGERFPASDGCNDCVCAASGLACTRRCSGLPEEGAILLESPTDACGDDPTFTAQAVLDGLPHPDLTVPFIYDHGGPLYPEDAPPTTLRLRVVREADGYIACRIPSPEQPALDIEALVEWKTADGAFDESFRSYLRRNNFGFVDGWYLAQGVAAGDLDGDFDPRCLDPNGFGFGATYLADGSASGDIGKACETDILLTVGTFAYAP